MLTKKSGEVLKKKRGFTLMELVIVIAILAILVTLGLLYYGNLTHSAHRTALLADMNSVDKAIAMYQNQYSKLPVMGVSTVTSGITSISGSDNVRPSIKVTDKIYVSQIDATDANLMSYIKKTAFLLKGSETGDKRGAGILYYVDSAVELINGTATAGTGNTISLDAADTEADDYYIGCTINITSGEGIGQSRVIIDYATAGKVATVNSDWTTDPDDTSVYSILPPVKAGDLLFVQSATTENLKILDTDEFPVYKY